MSAIVLCSVSLLTSGGNKAAAAENKAVKPPTPYEIRMALSDSLPELAEQLAGQLLESDVTEQEDLVEILSLYATALLQQEKSALLMEQLDVIAARHRHLSPACFTLWRTRALLAADRPQEALALLNDSAQENLPDTFARQLMMEKPRALLAVADTNAALQTFLDLRKIELPENDRIRTAVAEARLQRSLRQLVDAEKTLETLLADFDQSDNEKLDQVRWQLALWRTERGDDPAAGQLMQQLAETARAPDLRALAYLGLAGIAERGGEFGRAISLAESAHENARRPESVWAAQAALMRLFLHENELDSARKALENAIGAQQDQRLVAQLQLEMAAALLEKGEPAQALTAYQTVMQGVTDPELENQAQQGRTDALIALNRLPEAAVALLRVAELSSSSEQKENATFHAAELLGDAGLHSQAAESMERFQEIFPDSNLLPRAALLQGDYLAVTSLAQAEAKYIELAEKYPDSPEAARALFKAAMTAAHRDAPVEALELFHSSISHTGADMELKASGRVGAGLIHLRSFHFDRALNEFRKAADGSGPAAEQALYLQTVALYSLGRENEAIDNCRTFLKNTPDSPWAPDATYWMGRYFFNRQQFDEAENYFLSFTETWPTRPECDSALLWVARARFALKRWPEASAAALQIISDYPESPLLAAARMVHGESLCERMLFDEAILAFDELLALHRSTPWAAQALGRKGDSLFTLGTSDIQRYSESMAAYEELLEIPDLALDMQLQAAYKIGRCHEKSGQTDEALNKYYRDVILRYAEAREKGVWPNERSRAWYARATLSASALYEQRGQWSTAVAILKRMAAENVPGSSDAAERAQRILREHPDAAKLTR